MYFEFFRHFLVLLVPGVIGALTYSIVSSLRTRVNLSVALILDLLTFTAMITGLYFFKAVVTVDLLLNEFTCLSFTRNYILLSIIISIFFGVLFGILRRIFFWLRR